ncbi:dihydropteroate synthase [Marinobacter sp. 1Y8]
MNFAGRWVDLSKPGVMGILNVTPDSFSDGGRYDALDSAVAHAEKMMREGAVFIDVGGESTRPGAAPVTVQEELDRVCPVVEAICRRLDVVVSVDTSTPEVISEAASLGAGLINDVRSLEREGALQAAAASSLPVCLMHMKGQPDNMQQAPYYDNVTAEVTAYLLARAAEAQVAGIAVDQIIFDPGFGFGKTVSHNFQLLAALDQLRAVGYPLLVGMSRKTMLGEITGREVGERLPAGLAASTIAALKGASIIRVHDVRETVDALKVVAALEEVSP